MRKLKLSINLILSLLLTTSVMALTSYAECQSYQDEIRGEVSGYYLLSCQICTHDYDRFDFDCNITYFGYSDSPGVYMNGDLRAYAAYIVSSNYLAMTFSSYGKGPLNVSIQGDMYQVFFDDVFVETVEGVVKRTGGYIVIDGVSYPFTPDLLDLTL